MNNLLVYRFLSSLLCHFWKHFFQQYIFFLQQHFILFSFQTLWKCWIYRVLQYIFSIVFQCCWLTTIWAIFCCHYGTIGFNFHTTWPGINDIIHHAEWASHHRPVKMLRQKQTKLVNTGYLFVLNINVPTNI